jgi:ketosteroid isomerase-like protein
VNEEEPMGERDRLSLIEAFTEAWTAGDLDAVMDLMADDCQFGASVGPEPGTRFVGRDAVRRGFSLFLAADGPPPESENAPVLVGEDFAVTRWTLRLPSADGPPTVVRGCDVFEFDGDRISAKDTYRKAPGQLVPSTD